MFAGDLRRVDGKLVRRVDLPPHTGAILLYSGASDTKKAPAGAKSKKATGKRNRSKTPLQ